MEQLLLETMKAYAALHHVPILLEPSTVVLQQAARDKRPSRVLEVGTAIGYSSLVIAREMTAGGQLISIDTDSERQRIASQFLAQARLLINIELVAGDACEVIPNLVGDFDFVFIDAAKGQYVNYLVALLPHLVTGAVIVADNVLFRGWVESGIQPPRRFRTIVRRLQEYLAIVRDKERFATQIYEIGDGLAVSVYQGKPQDQKMVQEGDDK
jgi:predicted O-methyltransferase YrrM